MDRQGGKISIQLLGMQNRARVTPFLPLNLSPSHQSFTALDRKCRIANSGVLPGDGRCEWQTAKHIQRMEPDSAT